MHTQTFKVTTHNATSSDCMYIYCKQMYVHKQETNSLKTRNFAHKQIKCADHTHCATGGPNQFWVSEGLEGVPIAGLEQDIGWATWRLSTCGSNGGQSTVYSCAISTAVHTHIHTVHLYICTPPAACWLLINTLLSICILQLYTYIATYVHLL